jgi:hypothetical protein
MSFEIRPWRRGKPQPVSTGKMPGRRCRIEVMPVARLAPRQRTCRIVPAR